MKNTHTLYFRNASLLNEHRLCRFAENEGKQQTEKELAGKQKLEKELKGNEAVNKGSIAQTIQGYLKSASSIPGLSFLNNETVMKFLGQEQELQGKQQTEKELAGKQKLEKELGGKQQADKELGGKQQTEKELAGKQKLEKELGGKQQTEKELGGKQQTEKELAGKQKLEKELGGKQAEVKSKENQAKEFSAKLAESQKTIQEQAKIMSDVTRPNADRVGAAVLMFSEMFNVGRLVLGQLRPSPQVQKELGGKQQLDKELGGKQQTEKELAGKQKLEKELGGKQKLEKELKANEANDNLPVAQVQNPGADADRLENGVSGNAKERQQLRTERTQRGQELAKLLADNGTPPLAETELGRKQMADIISRLQVIDKLTQALSKTVDAPAARIKELRAEQQRRNELVTRNISRSPSMVAELTGDRLTMTYANNIQNNAGLQLFQKSLNAMGASGMNVQISGNQLTITGVPPAFFNDANTQSIGTLLRDVGQGSAKQQVEKELNGKQEADKKGGQEADKKKQEVQKANESSEGRLKEFRETWSKRRTETQNAEKLFINDASNVEKFNTLNGAIKAETAHLMTIPAVMGFAPNNFTEGVEQIMKLMASVASSPDQLKMLGEVVARLEALAKLSSDAAKLHKQALEKAGKVKEIESKGKEKEGKAKEAEVKGKENEAAFDERLNKLGQEIITTNYNNQLALQAFAKTVDQPAAARMESGRKIENSLMMAIKRLEEIGRDVTISSNPRAETFMKELVRISGLVNKTLNEHRVVLAGLQKVEKAEKANEAENKAKEKVDKAADALEKARIAGIDKQIATANNTLHDVTDSLGGDQMRPDGARVQLRRDGIGALVDQMTILDTIVNPTPEQQKSIKAIRSTVGNMVVTLTQEMQKIEGQMKLNEAAALAKRLDTFNKTRIERRDTTTTAEADLRDTPVYANYERTAAAIKAEIAHLQTVGTAVEGNNAAIIKTTTADAQNRIAELQKLSKSINAIGMAMEVDNQISISQNTLQTVTKSLEADGTRSLGDQLRVRQEGMKQLLEQLNIVDKLSDSGNPTLEQQNTLRQTSARIRKTSALLGQQAENIQARIVKRRAELTTQVTALDQQIGKTFKTEFGYEQQVAAIEKRMVGLNGGQRKVAQMELTKAQAQLKVAADETAKLRTDRAALEATLKSLN